MLSKELIDKLKERYNLHPIVFSRSVARAKNDSDLFDILDAFPKEFPVVWSESEHRWVNSKDIWMVQDFVP